MADINKSLVGTKTTGGTTEESIDLSVDGAAAVTEVEFTAGKDVVISQAMLSCTDTDGGEVRFEASTDGGTAWFDIFPPIRLGGYGSTSLPFDQLKKIERVGSNPIKMRAFVTTPSTPQRVDVGIETFEN